MRFFSLKNNQQFTRLYRYHLDSLNCEPLSENLIDHIKLHLRNTDFYNIRSI